MSNQVTTYFYDRLWSKTMIFERKSKKKVKIGFFPEFRNSLGKKLKKVGKVNIRVP
jgi:hypothetical protein